jgi:16S rRNA (adenine1518-N6/adenine1519-N6)-dimethyltransferase
MAGRPKKSLGQNFLTDTHYQREIVDAVQLEPGDTLLEIGPGRGALTRHLVERAERFIAVELDNDLAPALQERYAEVDHVQIVHGDFMGFDLASACDDPARLVVIGNIPYNITTPILFKLLQEPRPRELLLMVQREVANRIVSEPGARSYGALAVGVQIVAEASVVVQVPATAFRPVPKVESSVVRIVPIRPAPLSLEIERRVRVLTRAAFQWRRKQLQKILRSHPDLGLSPEALNQVVARTGWDLSRRPETLSPAEFIRLSGVVHELR